MAALAGDDAAGERAADLAGLDAATVSPTTNGARWKSRRSTIGVSGSIMRQRRDQQQVGQLHRHRLRRGARAQPARDGVALRDEGATAPAPAASPPAPSP